MTMHACLHMRTRNGLSNTPRAALGCSRGGKGTSWCSLPPAHGLNLVTMNMRRRVRCDGKSRVLGGALFLFPPVPAMSSLGLLATGRRVVAGRLVATRIPRQEKSAHEHGPLHFVEHSSAYDKSLANLVVCGANSKTTSACQFVLKQK